MADLTQFEYRGFRIKWNPLSRYWEAWGPRSLYCMSDTKEGIKRMIDRLLT